MIDAEVESALLARDPTKDRIVPEFWRCERKPWTGGDDTCGDRPTVNQLS